MTSSIENSLQYIRSNQLDTPKRKGKGQSVKDFLISKYGLKCAYCRDTFKKRNLCLIKKNHTIPAGLFFEPINNKIIACRCCASYKSNMDHHEFIEQLKLENVQRVKIS